MSRRKGWDNLSNDYRERLRRKGITEALYDAGATLTPGRGHGTPAQEKFERDTIKAAREYTRFNKTIPQRQMVRQIRAMGRVKGERYMDLRSKMVRAYESGDVARAKQLWEQRDMSLPAYMFYYHGVFEY